VNLFTITFSSPHERTVVTGVLEENVRGIFHLPFTRILRVQKSARWDNTSSEEKVTSDILGSILHLSKQPVIVMMLLHSPVITTAE
jgi:hypothetical protein